MGVLQPSGWKRPRTVSMVMPSAVQSVDTVELSTGCIGLCLVIRRRGAAASAATVAAGSVVGKGSASHGRSRSGLNVLAPLSWRSRNAGSRTAVDAGGTVRSHACRSIVCGGGEHGERGRSRASRARDVPRRTPAQQSWRTSRTCPARCSGNRSCHREEACSASSSTSPTWNVGGSPTRSPGSTSSSRGPTTIPTPTGGSSAGETARSVLALYDAECRRSRMIVAAATLDEIAARSRRRAPIPRRFARCCVHMIAETSRHAGHADLLRQLIDGESSSLPCS